MIIISDAVGELTIVIKEFLGLGVEKSVLEYSEIGVVVEIFGSELDEFDLFSIKRGVLQFELSG